MRQGIWDRETIALLMIAALLPVAVAWALAAGPAAAVRFVLGLLTVAGWQLVFMLARAQPPSMSGVITAAAVAILAPPDLGTIPFLLGLSFGVVFGDLVFGGWGRNVLNPATVALAFLGFGFPAAPWPDLPAQLGWAAVPAALLGAALGLFSARLLAGAALVFGAACWIEPALREGATAFVAVLVLLVADPVASAGTRFGRWGNGALYAGLAVLFALAWSGAAPVQAAVAAALAASLAAPLLDEIAIAAWVARRRRRHG